MQSLIHLICGAIGAGKTTYARKLAQERQAIHFSIDEWMANLFVPDLRGLPDGGWMTERLERCDSQIWALCRQLIAQNREIVLDLGFLTQAQRAKFRRLADEAQTSTVLHHLTASVVARKQRVNARNKEKNDTYSFEVTDVMFSFMERRFESPTEEELKDAVVVDTERYNGVPSANPA